MLQFGMKPPLSHKDFLEECRRQLSAGDMANLEKNTVGLSKEWNIFDISLRNELVRLRSAKKGKNPDNYLRGTKETNPFTEPMAHWAVNQDSPMDAEKYLDKIRWEKIEDIKRGHYFDTDYLAAYGIQLRILERWDRIDSGGGMKILEELTGKI